MKALFGQEEEEEEENPMEEAHQRGEEARQTGFSRQQELKSHFDYSVILVRGIERE